MKSLLLISTIPVQMKRLLYPKNLGYTIADVNRERNKLGYPKAWIIINTKDNIILQLDDSKFRQHYVKPRKSNLFPDSPAAVDNPWKI